MFGANYPGGPYFGQNYIQTGITYLKSLSATVTASASLAWVIIYSQVLTATVSAGASLVKAVSVTLTAATVSLVATLASVAISPLRLLNAVTRFLGLRRRTKGLSDFNRSTTDISGFDRTTRRIN